MGKYLAVNFELEREHAPVELLVRTTYATPVALGAIAESKRTERKRSGRVHAFVSGFAVESFLERLSRRRRVVEPLHLARSPEAARTYLEGRVAIRSRASVTSSLSPFEVPHATLPLTQLPRDAELSAATFAELDAWRATRSRCEPKVVYAIDLATTHGEIERAVTVIDTAREPDRLTGYAILQVAAVASPFHPSRTELALRSSAPVWIPNGMAFGDAIGVLEADENLARFAELCAALVRANPRLVRGNVTVDGRELFANEARLRTAIEAAVGCELPARY